MAPRPVRFFATCLVDQFEPETGLAAVEVLERAGCAVSFDERQTCCGQPAFNLGHWEEARDVAKRTIALYRDADTPIVVPSGSCATMMKEFWPRLFADGSTERRDAEHVAALVREWSQYLVRDLDWKPPTEPDGPRPTITYHPSCHGLRGLRLTDEAATLLLHAGYDIVPLPGADRCCGFGGGFSVEMPEMSAKIMAEKLDAIESTTAQGARNVSCLDTGCLLHLRGGHEKRLGVREGRGACPRYDHVALLVRDALRARGPPSGPNTAPDAGTARKAETAHPPEAR